MITVNKKNLDELVQSGETLVFFFYKEDHVLSDMLFNYLRELDGMIGKDFQICTVDAESEIEVTDAFGVKEIPEIVVVKNKRIHCRDTKILYANQILRMVKE